MRIKYIFVLFTLLFSSFSFAQKLEKDSLVSIDGLKGKGIVIEEKDTLRADTIRREKNLSIFINTELSQPFLSVFDKSRTAFEINATARVYKKIHGTIQVGYEKQNYNKLDWNIDVDGVFYRIGGLYSIMEDVEERDDIVYGGLKIGYSSFNQTVNQYTIRVSNEEENRTGSFPTSSVSTTWVELVVGARVKLFKTNFFAGVEFSPRILIAESNPQGIDNLYTPGFGEQINGRSFAYQWTIGYRFKVF